MSTNFGIGNTTSSEFESNNLILPNEASTASPKLSTISFGDCSNTDDAAGSLDFNPAWASTTSIELATAAQATIVAAKPNLNSFLTTVQV
jgi:hypothetical protein